MADKLDPNGATPSDNGWHETALSTTRVALAVLNGDMRVTGVNRAFERLARSRGTAAEEFAAQLVAPPTTEQLNRGAEGVAPCGWSLSIREAANGSRLVELTPIPSVPNGPTRREPLTGLLLREAFVERLTVRLAAEGRGPFALLFLDLDGFKAINDELGHLAGDDCLKRIGERLSATVRSHDAVARYGGDEFVVLVEGVSQAEDLEPLRRRLRNAIGQPMPTPRGERSLGVSIGHALSSEGFDQPSEMLHAADRRMYAEKKA